MENSQAGAPQAQPNNKSVAQGAAPKVVPQVPVNQPVVKPAAAPVQPVAKPAPVPAPQPVAQPAVKPVQPAVAQAPAPLPAGQKPGAVPAKPGVPLPKDQGKSNQRFIVGCLGFFGCSLLLFVGVLFAFLAFGDTSSPIFSFLGGSSGQVVNTLITVINLIFLVLVFISFIFLMIGVFKIATAKKDDKEAKRKGSIFTFVSLVIMILFIMLWVVAYFFLADKRTATVVVTPIITTPVKTTNLTAPITIKFDATKAPKKAGSNILSYSWDFADGSKAVGAIQTHTFTKLGNFKVKLDVVSVETATKKEQTTPYTQDVTIQNVLATVVIKADKKTGTAPLTVKLDGSESSSPNGELTGYEWDLDENGTFDNGKDAKAEVTFDKAGTYKVSLRVTDSAGTPATGDLEIEVTKPDNPVATVEVEGLTGTILEANKSYVFTAANSVAVNGKIEKYEWQLGDGKTAGTRTVTRTFTGMGEYDITLRVTDSAKKVGETVKRFTVVFAQTAPTIALKTTPEAALGTISGQAPFEVTFDASASTDPNDNIVEYSWDFNGDAKTDDTNPVAKYTFTTAGTYKVILKVTDATNLTVKEEVGVQVAAAGLKVDIKTDTVAGVTPLVVKFDASGSSYPDGSISAYEWDFGDGGAPRMDAAKVSHQYTAIGTFTAKVSAITSDNKRGTAQVTINVRPVALKSCFEPSLETGKAPLEIQFDPTCSTGSVVKYRWNFAGLGTSSDRKPKFTFQDAGEYEVSLDVFDALNTIDTVSKKIIITPKQ